MEGRTALTIDQRSDARTEANTALEFRSHDSLQQLRDGVLFLLRKELRDFTLAEDLCNETFRIVLERLQRQPLEEPSKISSYLAQTARNLVIEHRRRGLRQLTVTGHQAAMEAIGDADLDPALILQSQSRAAAVRKVLQEIPRVRDREVLVRVYLYDQDKNQVCRELGISADHYKRVVHRARERFRTLIEQRHGRADLFSFAIF
jgi:RNA polymerase sigma-70 factor (ECF subfamily)